MRTILAIALCLAIAPAWAHSLTGVQTDLTGREPAVSFEAGEGTPFPAFTLADARGRSLDLAAFRGKVVVLDFIYASCADVCPLQSDLFAKLQADVAAGHMTDQVEFVSVSVDPERDTPAVRGAYGEAHGLKPDNWMFLAAANGEEARKLPQALGLKFDPQPDGSFSHSVVTYVLDSAGMLRARFFGLQFDPLNAVIYINALTHDHHERAPAQTSSSPSFWQRIERIF